MLPLSLSVMRKKHFVNSFQVVMHTAYVFVLLEGQNRIFVLVSIHIRLKYTIKNHTGQIFILK